MFIYQRVNSSNTDSFLLNQLDDWYKPPIVWSWNPYFLIMQSVFLLWLRHRSVFLNDVSHYARTHTQIALQSHIIHTYIAIYLSLSIFIPSGKLTMENHHFQWVNQLFLWPFSSSQTVSWPGPCARGASIHHALHRRLCGLCGASLRCLDGFLTWHSTRARWWDPPQSLSPSPLKTTRPGYD